MGIGQKSRASGYFLLPFMGQAFWEYPRLMAVGQRI
jgi:hypothetical protein